MEQTAEVARHRLRALRQARGWTLDELAARSHLAASTISRLETGARRISLDQLVFLARALGTSIDDLLVGDDADVVIRPLARGDGGALWLLSRPDDLSGRVVAKQRVPASEGPLTDHKSHPGRDWFYVLSGTVRLVLGGREHIVATGEAASFDTTTPHALAGVGGPAEILSILDQHGERAHLESL